MLQLALVMAAVLSSISAGGVPPRLRMRGPCKAEVGCEREVEVGCDREAEVGCERVGGLISAPMLRGGEGSLTDDLQKEGQHDNGERSNVATIEVAISLVRLIDASSSTRSLESALFTQVTKTLGNQPALHDLFNTNAKKRLQVTENQLAIAICSLGILAYHTENRVVIADKGGIEAVVRAMGEHASSLEVQQYACEALGYITSCDSALRSLVCPLNPKS